MKSRTKSQAPKQIEPPSHFRPHPWHGLDPGAEAPAVVDAFIEMTPFDLMKYELDKVSGYVRVDRPQRLSSNVPALYGFIPRTYCGGLVGALVARGTQGDGDPLDICVLSERPISRAEILIRSRVVGGLQMVDHGEADDKIIAVLANDDVFGSVRRIEDLPSAMVERLEHYFLAYKSRPRMKSPARVHQVYGRRHAVAVVRAAMQDYRDRFGS